MNHFAAIDFETANEQPSSVCSVGIVIVRYGIPEQTIYRLIRPEPDYYLYRNTMIHGLNARDTENARVFSHVWKAVRWPSRNQWLQNDPLLKILDNLLVWCYAVFIERFNGEIIIKIAVQAVNDQGCVAVHHVIQV